MKVRQLIATILLLSVTCFLTACNHSEKPEVVGQIMVTEVNTVDEDDPIDQVMDIFSRTDARLIPVLNNNKKLVGTINKTDLVNNLA